MVLMGRDVTRIFSSDEIKEFRDGADDPEDPFLIKYIRQRWLDGPSKKKYSLSKEKLHYSQVGQSAMVDELLKKKRNGFFIECGAADGQAFSNTLFFERERNWTGLLVEANPGLYQTLLNRNRKAFSINACLSISNMTKQTKFKPVGLLGGISGTMDETHLRFVKTQPSFQHDITVQCFPLFSIMLALGVKTIDYFSLDVEGPELEILETIPFHKLYIKVFSVEYRLNDMVKTDEEGSMKKLNKLRDFFKRTGIYEEAGIRPQFTDKKQTDRQGLDVIFVRK